MKNSYILLIIVSTLLIGSCKKDDDNKQPRTVEYSIECPDCFVVYYDANGGQVSLQNQNSSWKQTIEAKQGGIVLLAAQNSSGSPSAVTGRIKLNGSVLAEKTTYCPTSGTVLVTDTIQ